MNQAQKVSPVSQPMNEKTEQAIRDIGKSSQMLRLIVGLSIVTLFYLILLIRMIAAGNELQSNVISSFTAPTALLGDLTSAVTTMIVILAVILAVRLIPLTGCILLYKKCKNGLSFQSMSSVLTLLQIFGIIESLAWAALTVYDIVQIFRNGWNVPYNAHSTYYMMLVVSVLMIICKIIQGFTLSKFMAQLRKNAKQDTIDKKLPSGLKLSTVMIITCHAILLIFIVMTLIIQVGITYFFELFRYFWMIYLFLIGYICSNAFFSTLLKTYYQRLFLAENASTAPKSPPYVQHHQNYYSGYPQQNQNFNSGYSQQNQSFNSGYPQQNQNFNSGYPQQNQSFNSGYPQQNQSFNSGYPQQNQSFNSGYPQQNQSFNSGYPQQNQNFNSGYPQQNQFSDRNYTLLPDDQLPDISQSESRPSSVDDPFENMFSFNTHKHK